MFYCNHHIDIDALQFVQVDIQSSYVWYWVSYCNEHSDMDAPECVHIYVTSGRFVPEYFIQLNTAIWTLTNM